MFPQPSWPAFSAKQAPPSMDSRKIARPEQTLKYLERPGFHTKPQLIPYTHPFYAKNDYGICNTWHNKLHSQAFLQQIFQTQNGGIIVYTKLSILPDSTACTLASKPRSYGLSCRFLTDLTSVLKNLWCGYCQYH